MNKINKSKNIKKLISLLPFFILVLIVFLAFGSSNIDKKYNEKVNKNKTFEEINISKDRIKTIFDKTIKNRIIKKLDQNLIVGENDKYIENGYYDVKTYIQNNKCIVVCLNKLWKEFDERLYEEDYITEIAESIKNILAINVPLNQIYDYILSGYLVAKNSDNTSNNKEYMLDLDNYVIKGKVLDNEFVMSIYEK